MKFRGLIPKAFLGLAVVLLGGCLVDLYGGTPRLQYKNSTPFQILTVGIGDRDRPTWKHDFEPRLKAGKSSEVIDLPTAGDFQMWIHISDTLAGWDTVLIRQDRLEMGDFRLVEVSGDNRSNLHSSP